MRNIFLTLVLANLLLLAWQYWIAPDSPAPAVRAAGGLELYAGGRTGSPVPAAKGRASAPVAPAAEPPPGVCLRVGPLPSAVAAQQAGARLAAEGVDAVPIERDTQLWLGHLVQIGGFSTAEAAENVRRQLVAGGLTDTYLMQDGTQPALSLGVFRDRSRADRVVGVARSLGFQPRMRDRYRPTVEQWLLIRPRPGQALRPVIQSLAGDRIMRTESVSCGPAVSPTVPPAAAAPE